MWADPEGFDGIPELVMRVTRNEKVSSATYYEIDAALHARGSKEPFLKWTCMRTLAILRVHIHDLVERNLGSEVYKKHFKGTPFLLVEVSLARLHDSMHGLRHAESVLASHC